MFEITQKINTLKPASARFYNPIIELLMQRNERDKSFAVIETMIAHGAKPDSLSYLPSPPSPSPPPSLFTHLPLSHLFFVTTERYGLIMKMLDPMKDFNLIVDTYKRMRNDGARPSGVTVWMMMEAYGRNGLYDKVLIIFVPIL
jgi:hypothetical protein